METAWDARAFFEGVRAAALDAERVRRQLDEMEATAEPPSGGGLGARVRSTPDPDRIGGRVAAMLDHERRLLERQEEDYRVIDSACALLYGDDCDAGLWALVGWRADAIFHHYVALRTWDDAARMVGYSTRYVIEQAGAALDVATANGAMWTRLGIGSAVT